MGGGGCKSDYKDCFRSQKETLWEITYSYLLSNNIFICNYLRSEEEADDDDGASKRGRGRGTTRASPAKATRAARGGRGSRKAPVVTGASQQPSISAVFARQSQSLGRAKKGPINYGSSDSD